MLFSLIARVGGSVESGVGRGDWMGGGGNGEIKIKIRIIIIVVLQHPEKGCYHTTMNKNYRGML